MGKKFINISSVSSSNYEEAPSFFAIFWAATCERVIGEPTYHIIIFSSSPYGGLDKTEVNK
jgi:hypothetical protein